jgi:hypothetical protein
MCETRMAQKFQAGQRTIPLFHSQETYICKDKFVGNLPGRNSICVNNRVLEPITHYAGLKERSINLPSCNIIKWLVLIYKPVLTVSVWNADHLETRINHSNCLVTASDIRPGRSR